MNYEIVCMDEKDTVSGNWTMKQVYDYCNSNYGCGGYGYDLKLPSGQGIAVLGYGGSDYKDRTLDEFVAFAEKDIQKVELKGNLLYDYGEIVDNFIENDSEYDQISALFEKDKGLHTPEEKETCIRDIYEKINSKEGFPVCFTLNENKLFSEEVISKIDSDLISEKMLKTNFLNKGEPENTQIFLLANYKPENDRTYYKIDNVAVVEENGENEILKIREEMILPKDYLTIVPEENIPSIVKEMTKAQISEISDKKIITNFDKIGTFDNNYTIKFAQKEVKKIKSSFQKLGINTNFRENFDNEIIMLLSKNEKGKNFTATYKITNSSYAELRVDLYFCIKNMDLKEKNFSKTVENFEKLLDKRTNFDSEYRSSGNIISKKEFNKIYSENVNEEKNEKIKQKVR